jgi:FG-GAP repeat protein/VCBS repeat protein
MTGVPVPSRIRTALAATAVAALTGGLLVAVVPAASAVTPSGLKGDFNGDGYADVAVQAQDATVGGKVRAGAVVVLYGSPSGITAARRTVLTQDLSWIPGGAEANDGFGSTAAAGDFNGDGYADLAIGASGENLGTDAAEGLVTIVWGSASGLNAGTTVADPNAAHHDRYGQALAAADFDGDGKADLAIGSDHAQIDVFRGGFTKAGGNGGHYTVAPVIQSGGPTGPLVLTPGDVNGDGKADLVVDGYETTSTQGWNANYWVPGSASGLTMTGAQKLSPGIITAIGDTDGDGYGDIVIGEGWDASSGVPGATLGGKVTILFGSSSGPDDGSQEIDQDTPGIPGGSESGDQFGGDLSLGDINGDGQLDLAIGVWGESLGSAAHAGGVVVVYGTSAGLDPAHAQAFNQETPVVPGGSETNDMFGSDVHLADVNGDGKDDLTIGVGGEDFRRGAVTSIRSNGTRLDAATSVNVTAAAAGLASAGPAGFGISFAD